MTLQRLIELEAENERLREYLTWVSTEGHVVMSTKCPGGENCRCGVAKARQILRDQPTPTTGLLDVVRAAVAWYQNEPCGCIAMEPVVDCEECIAHINKLWATMKALPPEVMKSLEG